MRNGVQLRVERVERTHEPCVPTYFLSRYRRNPIRHRGAKRSVISAILQGVVGTHGSCVRSNGAQSRACFGMIWRSERVNRASAAGYITHLPYNMADMSAQNG